MRLADPRFAALLGASRGGSPQAKSEQPECKTPQGRAGARPCGLGHLTSEFVFGLPAVMRRREAQVQADQGWRCLSEASLARPRLRRARVFGVRDQIRRAFRLARRVRRKAPQRNWCLTPITPTNPARLSFGYFSLAKQRKRTSPAGARPGMPRELPDTTVARRDETPAKARRRRKTRLQFSVQGTPRSPSHPPAPDRACPAPARRHRTTR